MRWGWEDGVDKLGTPCTDYRVTVCAEGVALQVSMLRSSPGWYPAPGQLRLSLMFLFLYLIFYVMKYFLNVISHVTENYIILFKQVKIIVSVSGLFQ